MDVGCKSWRWALVPMLALGLLACRRAPRRGAAQDAGVVFALVAASVAAPGPAPVEAGVVRAAPLDAGVADPADASAHDGSAPTAKPAQPGPRKRRPPRPHGRSDCDTTYCDNEGNCWPGRCP